ncbi:MAG: CDP-glycerol glycerophosphotransferase family protein, partial [Helicobacter sp.]|nr:CDP-glycerol glycerophosphotransferase family protein [Helicobacter sp.]
MNVLKPFLSPKKLRKLQNNPKAFFKDALDKRIIPIENQLKSLKPKKKHGFAEYYIISAVYNVEKYLDDYFNSILKQRLDFKNNITIICVDDGSTDRSAEIIQKYQKRFPENIVYLHKENGGQASARNLGIKWLQEKLGYLESASAEITGEIPYHRLPRLDKSSLAMTQSHQTSSCEDDRIKQSITLHTKDSTMQSQKSNMIDYPKASLNDSQKPIWVTFTDPDDFLDRDYFYEVDKFLGENADKDICMVGCNVIFYYEAKNAFSDTHPLKNKFKDVATTKRNKNLNGLIQLAVMSAFFPLGRIGSLRMDEDLKPNFEDAKFVNEFLMANMESSSAFLRNAKLYYRKRSDGSSTLDNVLEADKKQISKMGFLLRLLLNAKESFKFPPAFLQNTILYDLFWQIKATLNKSSKFSFHTPREREEFFSLLDRIYSLIDTQRILEFNLADCWFYHKVGILNCFKKEYPPFQITYIDGFDAVKRQILIRYFTPDAKDIESFRIDGEEVYADYEKIVQNDFLDRVFCYEKRFWVHIPQNSNELEIFVRGQKARITFGGKQHQSLVVAYIEDEFQQIQNSNTLWLLMDRDTEADDNAEHFYRYLAKNYPKQNIVFALRRESKDWTRLQKEGFNLVAFDTQEFRDILKNSSKVISSHIDAYLVNHLGKDTLKGKDFVFLQHGVILNDLSSWLNSKQVSLFITSTQGEYDSIVGDFNHYIFGIKEMQLTELARHDRLLSKSLSYQKQSQATRQILLMPTWRKHLSGDMIGNGNARKYNPQFLESQYFHYWNTLLSSQTLQQLCEKYRCNIVFNPHQNTMPYIKDFAIPSFAKMKTDETSLQQLFIESDIMITDYSSVSFEMAYLKKPVLYYQFDEEEFRNNQYQKGYFDYCKDGFGPVVTTEEELLKELEILLQNDCKVGEPYKSNIENTFEFRDGKCCERIYNAILELDKPYERKWTLDYVLNLARNALNAKCYKEASKRFRFVLEHLGESEFSDTQVILNEEIIFNYLYTSRLNQTSQEALEFIKAKEYERKLALSNKTKLEIIKNYIEILDAKEVIARLEDLRETIPQTDLLEFAYLKLRIYAYLGDKVKLKEVYN